MLIDPSEYDYRGKEEGRIVVPWVFLMFNVSCFFHLLINEEAANSIANARSTFKLLWSS